MSNEKEIKHIYICFFESLILESNCIAMEYELTGLFVRLFTEKWEWEPGFFGLVTKYLRVFFFFYFFADIFTVCFPTIYLYYKG